MSAERLVVPDMHLKGERPSPAKQMPDVEQQGHEGTITMPLIPGVPHPQPPPPAPSSIAAQFLTAPQMEGVLVDGPQVPPASQVSVPLGQVTQLPPALPMPPHHQQQFTATPQMIPQAYGFMEMHPQAFVPTHHMTHNGPGSHGGFQMPMYPNAYGGNGFYQPMHPMPHPGHHQMPHPMHHHMHPMAHPLYQMAPIPGMPPFAPAQAQQPGMMMQPHSGSIVPQLPQAPEERSAENQK